MLPSYLRYSALWTKVHGKDEARASSATTPDPPPHMIPLYASIPSSAFDEPLDQPTTVPPHASDSHAPSVTAGADPPKVSAAGPEVVASMRAPQTANRSSPLRRRHPPAVVTRSMSPQPLIPSAWYPDDYSKADNHSLLSLSKDGLRVSYIGPGATDEQAAAIRSNLPIPKEAGIFYFEVTIISKGRDGWIGIGVCDSSFNLNRLPGWDPRSWGYHGDDGFAFAANSKGSPYGPVYTTGDVIGCRVNFRTMTVAYTKNGMDIGVAFTNLPRDLPLFCVVGMRTAGEILEANFGHRPFCYNIDLHIEDECTDLRTRILGQEINLRTPLAPAATSKAPSNSVNGASASSASISNPTLSSHIDPLILSHLLHNGYLGTADAFRRTLSHALPSPTAPIANYINGHADDFAASSRMDIDPPAIYLPDTLPPSTAPILPQLPALALTIPPSLELRHRIRSLLLAGRPRDAQDLIAKSFPGLLERRRAVLFALMCQEFVEHVAVNSAAAARKGKNEGGGGAMNGSAEVGGWEMGAVEVGRRVAACFDRRRMPECVGQALDECFSFLAYENPWEAPTRLLLEAGGREVVASLVDREVLIESGEERVSRLERVVKQTAVAVEELKARGELLMDGWERIL
ncbi:Ran-binding protein 10 [Irineochytrium annulatum]|nr:Ran-binding protein 10 [Irineochytrium annulatum]